MRYPVIMGAAYRREERTADYDLNGDQLRNSRKNRAMPNTTGSQGFIAIFLLIMILIGAVSGAAIGAMLDGSQERLIALVAAFSAVIIISVVRRGLGKAFPSLFLARRGSKVPLAVWIATIYSTLLGGLAGHDLGQFSGMTSGALVGLFSGILAATSMTTLIMIYLTQHPEERIEF